MQNSKITSVASFKGRTRSLCEAPVANYAPVFIVGVGRSGTTLLRMMIHHHPMIALPYESHFITKYLGEYDPHTALEKPELKRLLQNILNEPLLQKWDHEFSEEKLLDATNEPTLSGVLNAVYVDYAKGKHKQMWGDKSDYLDRMFQINSVFPDARFIHIVRDGRDVARSVMKMSWGPNDVIEAAEWWSSYVRLGRSMGRMLPANRYMEVSYERLVTSTESATKDICEYLGLPHSSSMVDHHKYSLTAIPESKRWQHSNVDHAPRTDRVQAWKRSMKPTDVLLFEKYAGRELMDFGYRKSGYSRSALRQRMAQNLTLAKRVFTSR